MWYSVSVTNRLGKRIESARRAKEMNQAQLAAAIGRERSTVAGYESGGIEPPLSMLEAIAEATGKSLFDLLGHKLSAGDILRALAQLNPGSSNPGPALDCAVPIQGIVVGLLIKAGEQEEA